MGCRDCSRSFLTGDNRVNRVARSGFSVSSAFSCQISAVSDARLADTSFAGTDGAPLINMAAPLRILAVDNEPTITFSLKYVFAGPRYEFTSADSGEAALTRLDANPDPYDVIIVDQKMPHQSGVELVTAIRQRGLNGKIIVLSAHLSSEVRADYARMDVNEMFDKPFDVEELRSAVNRLAA